MDNPFQVNYNDASDNALVQACLDGSRQALEALVKRHQDYIHNIALKMVLNPTDAEDITQEVLIKMITKLAQFKAKSAFRTWLYRIAFNHILELKRQKLETVIISFDQYGQDLDNIPLQDLTELEQNEMNEIIEEAKIGCMAGMLLCLNREQRAVYILGEIFNADHRIGSEMLEISADNFRQKLARARKDLYQFMNNKCGLINKENPCRCAKKTKGFIEAGWVDSAHLKFNTAHKKKIFQVSEPKSKVLNALLAEQYAVLFQEHPFQEKNHHESLLKNILKEKEILSLFDLDN
jgi:RNA polymerase sigma factor (sigma-70 family)